MPPGQKVLPAGRPPSRDPHRAFGHKTQSFRRNVRQPMPRPAGCLDPSLLAVGGFDPRRSPGPRPSVPVRVLRAELQGVVVSSSVSLSALGSTDTGHALLCSLA